LNEKQINWEEVTVPIGKHENEENLRECGFVSRIAPLPLSDDRRISITKTKHTK